MDTRPIALFDSGSGGLSIWKSIVSLLPLESTVYVGDHRYIPYSTKNVEFIQRRGKCAIQFLISRKAKIIVVACNTATVAGIDYFRKIFPDIPIVGVVPVIKTAAKMSQKKKFGVLSTERTAKSDYQKKLIRTFASDCEVYPVGNTQLVSLIENGEKDSVRVVELLEKLLNPLCKKDVDVLVLGCTHFPFLRTQIQKIIGKSVLILDSGDAVAMQVKRILEHENLLSDNQKPTHQFFTTGNPAKVRDVISRLLERGIVVKTVPDSVQ